VDGMVRRYADYSAADGWTWQNQLSTVGSMILAISSTSISGRWMAPMIRNWLQVAGDSSSRWIITGLAKK